MSARAKSSIPSIRVWLTLAALATAGAFLASFHSIRQSNASTAAVAHTQQTLSTLIGFEGVLADVVFAGNDVALGRASADAFRRLAELSALTAADDSQQRRIGRIRQEIEDLVRARRDDADAATRLRTEALVRQSLSRTLRELRGEELRLLTARVEAAQQTSRQLTTTLILLAAGSAALLAWVFGLAVRDERRRQQNEAALRRTNQELDARVETRTGELNAALARERGLRSEAESSNRLKDDFLMTISHELRTPLNAILGWASILRTTSIAEDGRERAIAAIHDNARLQAQLIEDLLDTSRILTAKLRIEPTVVDLGRVVEEAVSVVAPAAAAKKLELEVRIGEPAVLILGDPLRLRQIVWNLVSNAVKFTKHGRVSVDIVRGGVDGDVQIVVKDSGIGIAPEFLAHVFERFRQERVGTTRPHGGLGLGLAIAKELAELHGGTMRVESAGEGQGSTFSVTLPTAAAREVQARAGLEARGGMSSANTSMPALDGTRVLVVDDDPASCEFVTTALESCGAHVTTAASAADAKQVLTTGTWDVLLVDVAMPEEDGYSLVRSLRGDGLRQPVAAFTAHAHADDRERARQAGCDLHLAKPIEATTLALAVAALSAGSRVHP